MKQSIKDHILKYYSHKVDDYSYQIDEQVINQSSIFLSIESEIKKGLYKNCQDGEDFFTVHSKEYIDQLHPTKVSPVEFWKYATKKFPLVTISGAPSKNKKEVNKNNLLMHLGLGNIDIVEAYFTKGYAENNKPKVLEIGPGYGSIYYHIRDKYGRTKTQDYYAIDVNPLFRYKKLFKTNGYTIPKEIPTNLDGVFSFNVFQHIAKAHRTEYYKQIFKLLKSEGVFAFDMFMLTETNKDVPKLWGHRDESGRRYCFMFDQLTEIDHVDEVIEELKTIGFEILRFQSQEKGNYGRIICYKK